ncbi:DeoR/GlpR family DNA-binding transcription regulator [Acetonema longum]|uniref:Transcriptional regulator, DeoR family protein n=1 Tax=Acetonema longum DSM 6540 TaxID=1009370 RepID=F7NGX8_9FIRM|nr:DeoR/GlpR family DNA-binding transcription regulator [Acetonema longum]EGO64709.1 transcriptional regulator, DeoR family protein [Acetonema longum DSM 6540]
MFAAERKMEILQLVNTGNPVTVTSLSQRFGISESTVRRDLQELEDSGLIQRTHGGAISVQTGFEMSFQEKEVRLLTEKRQIAMLAADLVQDGETILLDSGTTTLEIARLLRNKKITVATNSMDIAQVFGDEAGVEILLLGGTLRKNTRSLVGGLTNDALRRMCFDKVFLAANAIDAEFGITTPNLTEAETKQYMLHAGKEKFLAADHSKFGQKSLCRVCGLEDLDLLITDTGLTEADAKQLGALVELRTETIGGGRVTACE